MTSKIIQIIKIVCLRPDTNHKKVFLTTFMKKTKTTKKNQEVKQE